MGGYIWVCSMMGTFALWTFRKCRTHTVCFYVFIFINVFIYFCTFTSLYVVRIYTYVKVECIRFYVSEKHINKYIFLFLHNVTKWQLDWTWWTIKYYFHCDVCWFFFCSNIKCLIFIPSLFFTNTVVYFVNEYTKFCHLFRNLFLGLVEMTVEFFMLVLLYCNRL